MHTFSLKAAQALCSMLLLFVFVAIGPGCSDDPVVGPVDCTTDDVCPLGQVCLGTTGQCGTAACEFCLAGQICYQAADGTSSCSRPECFSNTECTAPETCIEGLCKESSCSTKADCPTGQICNLASQCIAPPAMCSSDNDCPAGNICPDSGLCRPGCNRNSDCSGGEVCDTGSNACVAGCADSTECEADQTCDANNVCACDASSCGPDESCDASTQRCAANPINSCDGVNCPDGKFCDATQNFQCVDGCSSTPGNPAACEEGSLCDTSTGQCIENNCQPGDGPEQCTNPNRPNWDPVNCFCAECLGDTDCEAGESCTNNGICNICNACDPNQSGQCGDGFCVGGCCAECLSAVDCTTPGDVCVSGNCGPEPSCSDDPTVCTDGLECQDGVCKEPTGDGGACDINSPVGCPVGQTCTLPDPNPNGNSMGTCRTRDGGGIGGCGLCNPDCTCDGNAVCNGSVCTCDIFAGMGDCGSGSTCLPLLNICLPF